MLYDTEFDKKLKAYINHLLYIVNPDLKASMVGAVTMLSGSRFHSLMAEGKKECW